MTSEHWPLHDLRVRTPRVELRPPDEPTMFALVELASKGIHDPAFMPFLHPWTREPDGIRQRHSLQHYWRAWAEFRPESWHLSMAVRVDGELVGAQDLFATDFPVTREFDTGSWLGLAHQGQGIGQEMRDAAIHLGFAGLGARRASTGAFFDNGPSIGVTIALGYEPNGDGLRIRDGAATREVRFKLERTAWESRPRHDITIDGLEPCLAMFGLA